MQLLVFAHYGEAQAFIDQFELKRDHFLGQAHFYNFDMHLLITGEGSEQVLTILSAFLSAHPEVKVVLNFGVAGALREQFKLNDIFEIRSLYRYSHKVEFQSFHTESTETIDCVSVDDRSLSFEQKSKLIPLAQIVDREAWAIGKVCKIYKLHLRVFKLISDEFKQEHFCEFVKEQAQVFSGQLLNKYQSLEYKVIEAPTRIIELGDGFFLTHSMSHQFKQQFELLESIYNLSEDEVLKLLKLDELKQLKLTPKQRTKLLLERMQVLSNPIEAKMKDKLNTLISPLQKMGTQILADKQLEDPSLKISFEINTAQDIEKQKRNLDLLPLKEIQALFRGEDV